MQTAADVRTYFTVLSPTATLSGLTTFLEDRRDSARKQDMLLDAQSPLHADLRRVVDYYDEQLAALAPYKATVASIEKVWYWTARHAVGPPGRRAGVLGGGGLPGESHGLTGVRALFFATTSTRAAGRRLSSSLCNR